MRILFEAFGKFRTIIGAASRMPSRKHAWVLHLHACEATIESVAGSAAVLAASPSSENPNEPNPAIVQTIRNQCTISAGMEWTGVPLRKINSARCRAEYEKRASQPVGSVSPQQCCAPACFKKRAREKRRDVMASIRVKSSRVRMASFC